MAPVAAARAPTGAAVTVGPCGQLIDDDDIVNNRWAAHSTEAAAVAAQSIQPITISSIFPYCFASVLLFLFSFFSDFFFYDFIGAVVVVFVLILVSGFVLI